MRVLFTLKRECDAHKARVETLIPAMIFQEGRRTTYAHAYPLCINAEKKATFTDKTISRKKLEEPVVSSCGSVYKMLENDSQHVVYICM